VCLLFWGWKWKPNVTIGKKTPKSHSKSCNSIFDQTELSDCSRTSSAEWCKIQTLIVNYEIPFGPCLITQLNTKGKRKRDSTVKISVTFFYVLGSFLIIPIPYASLEWSMLPFEIEQRSSTLIITNFIIIIIPPGINEWII